MWTRSAHVVDDSHRDTGLVYFTFHVETTAPLLLVSNMHALKSPLSSAVLPLVLPPTTNEPSPCITSLPGLCSQPWSHR